jgi:hypothetical protein
LSSRKRNVSIPVTEKLSNQYKKTDDGEKLIFVLPLSKVSCYPADFLVRRTYNKKGNALLRIPFFAHHS